MSSQTIDDSRRKRVQRAIKRGLTVVEIAAREGVSTRTIERIVSGRRFQGTLLQLRPQLAVRRLMDASLIGQIQEKELRVLKTAHSKAGPGEGIGLRVRDLVDLARLADLLRQQAEVLLGDQ
jgi:transposase